MKQLKLGWLSYDGMERHGNALHVLLGWGIYPLGDYIIYLS